MQSLPSYEHPPIQLINLQQYIIVTQSPSFTLELAVGVVLLTALIKFIVPCALYVCSVVSDALQPHGIFQARILEWVAKSNSRRSFRLRD